MRDTSVQAFVNLKNVSDKQADVLITISGNPDITDKTIAELLGWAINRVTPRRLELEQKGYVQSSGTILQNGRRSHIWRVVKK